MNRILTNIFILFFLFTNQSIAQENIMILKLKDGDVKIELFEDVAPNHVKRIKELANEGQYDNVVFHRVIDGFMAQTGDVKFGNSESKDFNLTKAGMGGSDLPDLKEKMYDNLHQCDLAIQIIGEIIIKQKLHYEKSNCNFRNRYIGSMWFW